MNAANLAWVLRTVMVVAAAVVAYLLVQTDVELDPVMRVVLGAIAVGLAAVNPQSVANRVRQA